MSHGQKSEENDGLEDQKATSTGAEHATTAGRSSDWADALLPLEYGRLVAKPPFSNFSLDDICCDARPVTPAYRRLVDDLRSLAATPGQPAKRRLRLVLDRLCELAPEERLMLRTALRELMTAPEHLGPIAKTMQLGHPVVLLGLLQECVAEGSLPSGTGIGLLPLIMGTLVFAPVMLSIANAAIGDLGLIEIALNAGRDDLYRLLGLS
jgi:hypothetical protein